MTTIALIGAGGKMGCRLTDNLKNGNHEMIYVEVSEKGINNLAARGLTPTPQEEAINKADVVILAVPDVSIGKVANELVPLMKSHSLLILLDPAAAYLNKLPARDDITYFISHPCHPPIFNDEVTQEARKDFFGGISAKQAIVCALMQGPEKDYKKGEGIAREMFAPILRSHRVTIEQMATLEPTMAETIGATIAMTLREAMDEAVNRGVPYEAARDFMLGHIHIELAIAFGEAGNPFSDACLVAIEYGRQKMIKENWKEMFEPENVKEQIDIMLHPDKLSTLQK